MDATTEALRSLAAVSRRGSMAAAAKALGVDKATISRRLSALELQMPGLFERRAGRIELTELAGRALEALSEVDRASSRLAELLKAPTEVQGTVRLTVPAPIAAHIVIPALSAFRSAHPNVNVVLLATSRVLDLARDEADVAVRNVVPRGEGIVSRRVARVAAGLYASKGYIERRGVPKEHTLAGHDFVDFEHATYAQAPLDWLPEAVRQARVVLRADDPAILTKAVAAGIGVGALPAFLAEDEPELVLLGGEVSVTDVHVLVRAEVRRVARVRAVANWIGGVMASSLEWLVRPQPKSR
jgi:DNA-binding transcriptional LysR family regulator